MRGESVWLFSYGTLRDPGVQREVFGRAITAHPDTLAGFVVGTIRIGDGDYLILRPGGRDDIVTGVALAVSDDELAQSDLYETNDYVRVTVTLASAREAQVYVARTPNARVV